jgi:integrase
MTIRTPSYRLHKPSGQAVVTLNWRDFYLGQWNSPESRAEYDRLVAEWLARGRTLPTASAPADLTVTGVILAFWDFAEKRYPPSGRELENFRLSLQPLRDLYGHTRAREFGPRAIKTVQQRMIELDWCRNVINRRVTRIKTMFKWAESEELVPASTLHALQTVRGLSKGMPGVRETARIEPAFWNDLAVILPYCTRTVAAMLQLQWWSGMRSCEVRIMRTRDIDRTNPAWLYRPVKHKNDWRADDQQRVVVLGPKCQQILAGWLRPEALEECLFQPRRAMAEANAKRRAERRSPHGPRTAIHPGHAALWSAGSAQSFRGNGQTRLIGI